MNGPFVLFIRFSSIAADFVSSLLLCFSFKSFKVTRKLTFSSGKMNRGLTGHRGGLMRVGGTTSFVADGLLGVFFPFWKTTGVLIALTLEHSFRDTQSCILSYDGMYTSFRYYGLELLSNHSDRCVFDYSPVIDQWLLWHTILWSARDLNNRCLANRLG